MCLSLFQGPDYNIRIHDYRETGRNFYREEVDIVFLSPVSCLKLKLAADKYLNTLPMVIDAMFLSIN